MPRPSRPPSLLRTRLARLRRVLPGIAERNPAAIHVARTSTRRLRELVPLLGLERSRARKLMRRLRKAGRQLGRVRDLDIQAELLERMITRDGSGRLLRELRDSLRPKVERQWQDIPAPKLVARVSRLIKQLVEADQSVGSHRQQRALRWAAQARVARRAQDVRKAVVRAGAMYEPELLHDVRIAVKKLRYAAEVAADLGSVHRADVARLKRVQNILGRQHDAEVLLDQIRDAGSGDDTPSLANWREAGRVASWLDARCRRLHAKFLRERTLLLQVCDRVGPSALTAPSRRKAG